MTSKIEQQPGPGSVRRENGSALVLALLIMVIMTLLGLAFMLLGDTEAKIARNNRDSAQALYSAEGGVRIVRKWFEAPSGSLAYLVPTTSQMNRSLRYVDPDLDGTYVAYSSAASPWNVYYKQGTDDPFEMPYRGAPKDVFAGSEDHPDIRISEAGSSGERAFLTSLNNTLFPIYPAIIQRARVTQIDVYSPPMLAIGATFLRGGTVTIKVTAGVFENAGTAEERRISQRVVKAVLSELPYSALGAIQSCNTLSMGGNVAPHWGIVSAVTALDLPSNLDGKADSSVPYALNQYRIISRDMNLDGTLQVGGGGVGTPDDQDGNGAYDFDEWVSSADVEDPWLNFRSNGSVTSNAHSISPDCATADCQPSPFYQSPSTFGTGSNDHSNISQNSTQALCPSFDYTLWKGVAQSGAPNAYYYASDGPGSGTWKLNGTGSSVSFQTATNGVTGLLFFDTADNSPPVDANSDGIYENLSDAVTISGGGWTGGGFIYLNADFRTTGSGSVSAQRQLIAPQEPFIDTNGNGICDDDEYFVDLTYPGSSTGAYVKNGMRRVVDGYTHQDPAKDAGTAGKWNEDINMNGVLYSSGTYDARGNWIYFGSVVIRGVTDHAGLTGTPTYYYDDRLRRGLWPPSDMGLPRTMITAWETE